MEESYETVDVKYVNIQSGENVYVTWAENPTDFRVSSVSCCICLLPASVCLFVCFPY